MKNFFLIGCSRLLGVMLIFISFNQCQNISSSKASGSTSWIDIKTGLTDSTYSPDTSVTSVEAFAEKLNRGGFELKWDRADNAGYYEVRVSKNRITTKNWKKATLAATVPDRGDSINIATIDLIQPSISGRNCTGCQACILECPRHAINIFKGKAVIDLDSCIGCSRCYDICTYNAVSDLNLSKFYYFAVRAFTDDNVPAQDITCTKHTYKSRYVNLDTISIMGINIGWCGYCGPGCYILDPQEGQGIDLGGCPVDAIYYDSTGFIYIDQSKCIYCGICLKQCGFNGGHWSIRREVLSSEKEIS